MLELQPKDSRGYFMLPQAPEGAGYYVYGTPGNGGRQYAHSSLMSILFFIERKWQEIDERRFGIGNISLAGGGKFKPHDSHRNGLQVDVRPLRKDGRHAGVKYFESGYDRDATAKLIRLFTQHPFVTKVYFNDRRIPGVFPLDSHDNHFHVEIMAGTS